MSREKREERGERRESREKREEREARGERSESREAPRRLLLVSGDTLRLKRAVSQATLRQALLRCAEIREHSSRAQRQGGTAVFT